MRAIATVLIVPPINLAVVALICVLLARYRSWRRGTLVATISMAALVLLAVPVTGQLLLFSLEQNLPLEPPATPPQAIVVLSAELDHVRDAKSDVVVGSLTLERERAAAALARRTGLPILVAGGEISSDDPPIGDVMAESMKADFGVPAKWVENRSRSTWQNAEFSAEILRPLGITSIYLVTHAWHEKRALLAFRHFGMRPTASVVQLDALQGGIWPPTVSAWMRSYYGLHEWVGLTWYWIRAHWD